MHCAILCLPQMPMQSMCAAGLDSLTPPQSQSSAPTITSFSTWVRNPTDSWYRFRDFLSFTTQTMLMGPAESKCWYSQWTWCAFEFSLSHSSQEYFCLSLCLPFQQSIRLCHTIVAFSAEDIQFTQTRALDRQNTFNFRREFSACRSSIPFNTQ